MKRVRQPAERFFAEHATGYASSPSFATGDDLAALILALNPRKTDAAIDVATGAGFTALALAPLVGDVVGVDITHEMLSHARRIARERRITNIRFEEGDAQHLTFLHRHLTS